MKQSVFLTAIDRLSGSEIEFGRGPFTIADLNILFFFGFDDFDDFSFLSGIH